MDRPRREPAGPTEGDDSDREREAGGDACERPAGAGPPKDRIVQTRVPRDLETALKREARRRRLTVSHLVRNVLEDALQLVDGVVANVDALVDDSVELVRRVGSDARRVADAVRDAARSAEPAAGAAVDAVHAWNRVVLNRTTACSRCGRRLARGGEAWIGLGEKASRERTWLCGDCIEALSETDAPEGEGQ